jgi:hypothetical protein
MQTHSSAGWFFHPGGLSWSKGESIISRRADSLYFAAFILCSFYTLQLLYFAAFILCSFYTLQLLYFAAFIL